MKRFIFLALSAVMILSGCSKEGNFNNIGGEYGTVSIKLASDGRFVTKSGENVDVNAFYVKIKQGETTVKSYDRYSDMPNTIDIAPGSYTIEAGSAAAADAAWDQPVYYGTQQFDVKAGDVLSLSVTCSLSNMKVTVTCTDNFFNEMEDDFEIAITNGKGTLIYNKAKIEAGESGYFSVGTLTIDLTAKRKGTGDKIIDHRSISDGAAKDHFILNFDAVLTGEIGLGANGITLDYTLNNREEHIIVPGEDETPVEPDPEDEYLPTITGDGIGTPITISQSGSKPEKVDINIATLNGKTISDILVSIAHTDVTFSGTILTMGLDGEFSIVNFDDENGAVRKTTLVEELKLIEDPEISPIKGKANYTFGIGGFMEALAIFPGTADFKIKVIDSDNKEASATCTINIVE